MTNTKKKWRVLVVIAVILFIGLSISLPINFGLVSRTSALQEEILRTRANAYADGYDSARNHWGNVAYDVGHYDGWWTGYHKGYEDGTGYGLYMCGEANQYSRYSEDDAHREWRERYRQQRIYYRGYSYPYPYPYRSKK